MCPVLQASTLIELYISPMLCMYMLNIVTRVIILLRANKIVILPGDYYHT